MSQKRWGLCLGIILALGVPPAAYAQRTTGDITGTVTDGTGGVLPGSTVTAVCVDTSLTRSRRPMRRAATGCPSCRSASTA